MLTTPTPQMMEVQPQSFENTSISTSTNYSTNTSILFLVLTIHIVVVF